MSYHTSYLSNYFLVFLFVSFLRNMIIFVGKRKLGKGNKVWKKNIACIFKTFYCVWLLRQETKENIYQEQKICFTISCVYYVAFVYIQNWINNIKITMIIKRELQLQTYFSILKNKPLIRSNLISIV